VSTVAAPARTQLDKVEVFEYHPLIVQVALAHRAPVGGPLRARHSQSPIAARPRACASRFSHTHTHIHSFTHL
jgi:hypothetical protein